MSALLLFPLWKEYKQSSTQRKTLAVCDECSISDPLCIGGYGWKWNTGNSLWRASQQTVHLVQTGQEPVFLHLEVLTYMLIIHRVLTLDHQKHENCSKSRGLLYR